MRFQRAVAASIAVAAALSILGIGAADQAEGRVGRGPAVSSLADGKVPGPSRAGGSWTARVVVSTAVKSRPGGQRTVWRARGYTKWSGSEQRLMVLGSAMHQGRHWLKVRLPVRPNGSRGWIRRDRVQLARSPHYVTIDLSRRTLAIHRLGRLVSRFKVVVGAPSTPTPRGLFSIYDRVRQGDPKGFTGPWVLPITAHSEQLRRFEGGPGVVGLHGRGPASLGDPLGSARSHGCVRMNNSRIRELVRLAKGTAVRIRR